MNGWLFSCPRCNSIDLSLNFQYCEAMLRIFDEDPDVDPELACHPDADPDRDSGSQLNKDPSGSISR
jgi:hypothetical protein